MHTAHCTVLACNGLRDNVCLLQLATIKMGTKTATYRVSKKTLVTKLRPQMTTRKPSWCKGYARQHHHSKMAVSRHLGFYGTANSAIRSVDSENPNLEPNMQWIGCTVCEILAFKLYCDLETGVRGHSRSSHAAPLDRPSPKTPH